MELREYTDSLPTGGVTALAARLGISTVYLSQLAARQGGRVPGAALCVAIEKESGYAVRRWNLRPDDWHLIWPELITARGAPEPAAPEPAREPSKPAAHASDHPVARSGRDKPAKGDRRFAERKGRGER